MAISIASRAQSLAAKVSEETLTHMVAIMAADEDTRRGPLQLMFDLQGDLGDEMLSIPIVDSENEKGKAPTTNNPDWTEVKSQAGTTERMIRESWINTFIDATSSGAVVVFGERPALVGGREVEAFIDLYVPIVKDKNIPGQQSKDAKLELGYWQGRKATLRKTYRKAFKLDQFIRQIEDQSGGKIVVEIKRDTDGSPSSSKVPVYMYNKENLGDYLLLSVGSFLNLDLNLAQANGGTILDYSKTLAKGTNTEDVKLTPPLKFSDLLRTLMATTKLLSGDNMHSLINRTAKEKDTGDVFAHALVEASRVLVAAAVDCYPQWEKVEAEIQAEEQAEKARRLAEIAQRRKTA